MEWTSYILLEETRWGYCGRGKYIDKIHTFTYIND
jgi:hypothetical protein